MNTEAINLTDIQKIELLERKYINDIKTNSLYREDLKKYELSLFEWCKFNIKDSEKFIKASQYKSVLETIVRAMVVNKHRHGLCKSALTFTFQRLKEKASFLSTGD